MWRRIGELWAGERGLAEAFWWYAVALGLAVNGAATLAGLAVAAMAGPDAAVIALFLLPVPYIVLTLVAVWRSARRYAGRPVWATLARVAIVAWSIVEVLA
ncbi:MAG: hypothetical protein HY521_01880 [Proteobacteria bacterium]|nr:hypothetical protein [Pseudomonadota bacterium]